MDGIAIKFDAFENGIRSFKIIATQAAGDATFSVSLEKFNGRPVYHCVGVGKSYSFFDNFFKVRDRYETYIDTATMLPLKFIRNVSEGGYKIYNKFSTWSRYVFNFKKFCKVAYF